MTAHFVVVKTKQGFLSCIARLRGSFSTFETCVWHISSLLMVGTSGVMDVAYPVIQVSRNTLVRRKLQILHGQYNLAYRRYDFSAAW